MDEIEKHYSYQKYDGREVVLTLPERMEGHLITEIGSKAFFHCVTLQQLVLPSGVQTIGDWAFAQMKQLQKLTMPAVDLCMGRRVFQGCENLQEIQLRDIDVYEGIPLFLAGWFTKMGQEKATLAMLRSEEGQIQWLNLYDEQLLRLLKMPDDTGFTPTFVGWFDIEDVDDQKLDYMRLQRKWKIELVMERLCRNKALSIDNQQKMQEYIIRDASRRMETIRVSTGERIILETVQERVLALFHGENPQWGQRMDLIRTWQRIGGFSVWGPAILLEQMQNADPEIRSYLLGQMNAYGTNEDAWAL